MKIQKEVFEGITKLMFIQLGLPKAGTIEGDAEFTRRMVDALKDSLDAFGIEVADAGQGGSAEDPYAEALEKLRFLSGTNTEARIAKLILSLYNGDIFNFSVGESLSGLDRDNRRIALDMIRHFAEHGETAELRAAGEYCTKTYPGLRELASAANDAMSEVRQKWRREREAEEARLEEEERRRGGDHPESR